MKTLVHVLLIVVVSRCAGQDSLASNSGFHDLHSSPARKAVSVGMVGAIFAGILADSYFTWWRNAAKPFSFYKSSWFGEHRGIDRFGHMYTSNFFYHTFRDIMLWGGHDPHTARWWAAGLAAFEGLSIEIGDGMSPYGFDYKDLTFNFLGVGYGIMQEEIPYLQNFNWKFSYWSARGLKSPANFTSDYDAMTIWVTVNMHNILPAAIQSYWPDWLQLGAGFSVDDNQSKRELLVGFDINLEAFEFRNDHARLAQKILNRAHWPMPAVKFTETKSPRYYIFGLR